MNRTCDVWRRRALAWVGLAVAVGLVASGCSTTAGQTAGTETAKLTGQPPGVPATQTSLPPEPDSPESPPLDLIVSEVPLPPPVPPEGQWQATSPLVPRAAAKPSSPDDVIELGVSDQPTVNIGGETPANFYPLTLVLQSGTVRVLKGCTAAGQGTYTAADDGAWQFDAGSLSLDQCLAQAQPGFETLLEQLRAADHWSYEQSSPADEGDGYSNPEFGRITLTSQNTPLQASFDYAGYAPVAWPAEPKPAPGDPSALNGTWRVDSIAGTGPATPAPSPNGPFTWDITIADGHITMPRGCNTGTNGAFLADPAGWWSFPVSGTRTLMACTDPERNQAEQTYDALGASLTWTTNGPDAIVLTAPAFQIHLARAA